MKELPVQGKTAVCLILCCAISLSGCVTRVYMPVEPAYDQHGTLRTDGHYVMDSYLAQLNDDLKACSKQR